MVNHIAATNLFLQDKNPILTNLNRLVEGNIYNFVKSEVGKVNAVLYVDTTTFRNVDTEQDHSFTSPELYNPIDVLGTNPPMSPNLTDVFDAVKDVLIESK